MKRPLPLKKGATIYITSTARKISIEEIQLAIDSLEVWGYHVRIGKNIGIKNHQFAGTEAERIASFQDALDDPDIDAIWCARGGYGTVKIIDEIDFTGFSENPKWIIGYSDVTVLHSHIHNLGIETLHSTMPIDLKRNTKESLTSLKNALSGNSISYMLPASKNNRLGIAKGVLIGGNLSILYSLLGSKSSIDTWGKVLFIEDVDEYLYHIDRMLMNLKRNGYFDGLAGLIIGSMTDMHDNSISFGKNATEIVLDIVSGYDFPVIFDFPAGHLDDNRTLLLGRNVKLEATSQYSSLTFQQ
ncbi:LD-carboxypeptidase [Leptobacterium sp. I13]|uniref:S66 peptidase family protein n=1 Tax=Leptobacterium meishanense TaxID=3128904 RepID=UPI0030EB540F